MRAQCIYALPLFGHKPPFLIRGSPKKKFAVRGRGLAYCRHFSDNGRGVQMRMSELFVQKNYKIQCFRMEKGLQKLGLEWRRVNFCADVFYGPPLS